MDSHKQDIVYSERFKAGRRRTYFFDIRKTRGGDNYVTLTESKRRDDGNGYDRHKIFVYKEDLFRFRDHLIALVAELEAQMPEYDFNEFARRAEEREREYREQLAIENVERSNQAERVNSETIIEEGSDVNDVNETTFESSEKNNMDEDDLSW